MRYLLINLLFLTACSPCLPHVGECADQYERFSKQHIVFKVVSKDSNGVKVHRIVKGKERKKVEFYDNEDFQYWQPIYCDRVIK